MRKIKHPYVDVVVGAACDDGMKPTFLRGDHVTVDTSVKRFKDNGIYYLGSAVGPNASFARAYVGKHLVRITFDNKRYTPHVIPIRNLDKFPVLGRAVMIRRMLWN